MLKNNRPVDPLFDGHPEKAVSQMTPEEKLHWLWLQMEFRWAIRNRKIVQHAGGTRVGRD